MIVVVVVPIIGISISITRMINISTKPANDESVFANLAKPIAAYA